MADSGKHTKTPSHAAEPKDGPAHASAPLGAGSSKPLGAGASLPFGKKPSGKHSEGTPSRPLREVAAESASDEASATEKNELVESPEVASAADPDPMPEALNSEAIPRIELDDAFFDGAASPTYQPAKSTVGTMPASMGFVPSNLPTVGQVASDYSRAGGAADTRYSDERRRKGRRRNLFVVLAALLVALGVFAAAAFAVVNSVVSSVDENLSQGVDTEALKDTLVEVKGPTEPFYVLLLGTDQSIQRDIDQSTEGIYRTDTIILGRVDPGQKRVTLVSVPRDTLVELGDYGIRKINAAYAFGGAPLAIQAISAVAGVPISHYLLVDMDGLAAVVDALGGVEVNVQYEIDDWDYTGHLDAGVQTLNGEQALIFARSRHAYDKVGDGDIIRTANQRALIGAIGRKILSSDAVTIAGTIQKLSEYIQTDLSVSDIVSYAAAMQGMDMDTSLYTATMPTEAYYENGVWVNYVLQDEWAEMMGRVRLGLPPTTSTVIDSGSGIVMASVGDGGAATGSQDGDDAQSAPVGTARCSVRNGAGVGGAAARVSEKVSGMGYEVLSVGDADSSSYPNTLVIYADYAYADQAEEIASQLGGNATAMANDGSYRIEGDILVVVGPDCAN